MNLVRINVYFNNNIWADYPNTRYGPTLPNLMAMKRYGPYRVDIREDMEEVCGKKSPHKSARSGEKYTTYLFCMHCLRTANKNY